MAFSSPLDLSGSSGSYLGPIPSASMVYGVSAPTSIAPVPSFHPLGSGAFGAGTYGTASRTFQAPPLRTLSNLPAPLGSNALAKIAGPKRPARPSYSLEGDPGVIAARAAAARRHAMYSGQMTRQKRNAIIRGGDVNLAKAQGLSAADIAATAANYDAGNADLARVDEQNKLAHQAIINQLAGRGILFSGETGYQEQQQGRNYGNQVYDLRTNMLDYLQQLADQMQAEQETEQEMIDQALTGAYQQELAQQAAWDQYYGGQG